MAVGCYRWSYCSTAPDRAESELETSGASHPPKKMREDHGTPSGTSIGGKSRSSLQSVRVSVIRISWLSLISTLLGLRKGSLFLRTLFTILVLLLQNLKLILLSSSTLVMTTATIVTSMVDSALVAKKKSVKPSLFSADSSPTGGADPNTGVFLDLTGSDFLVGGIRTVINPESDLQKTYVPQWSVTNGSRLDDGRVCRKMVDEFAPPKFFAFVRGMEHDQLFTEFNVGAARQMSLIAEVRMRAKYNVKERRRVKSVVEEKDELVKAKDKEIENLKAQMLLKEAGAAEAIRLRVEASNF
uniref:Transposase (Putative), gypsy type n=1 Tax=Tanacetum cinerariifolium TaxID=118510 RepID=A0A699IZ09_TANCI|nr:transposase (putative), gypsy type [Tanacetum cinerariifolium]